MSLVDYKQLFRRYMDSKLRALKKRWDDAYKEMRRTHAIAGAKHDEYRKALKLRDKEKRTKLIADTIQRTDAEFKIAYKEFLEADRAYMRIAKQVEKTALWDKDTSPSRAW